MTNSLRLDTSHVNPTANYGVTELVLTREGQEQMALLLPMIAYLSKNSGDRWITWVAPRHISRQLLESFGVDTRCIRLIHCSDIQQSLWITWEALAIGNSHTVIASLGRVSEKELAQLEQAAHQGECQGLLLRSRQDYLTARG